MIFLFFVAVMTAVVVPFPDSCRWGGGGGGGGTTEALASEDPRSGHTRAPRAKGHPLVAGAASSVVRGGGATSSVVRGGGEGASPERDLPATSTSGATAVAPEGAVLGAEASPPPTQSIKLHSGLS
jgi:hypothetical protein